MSCVSWAIAESKTEFSQFHFLDKQSKNTAVFQCLTHSDNKLKRLVSIIIEKKITTLQRKCQNLEFFLPVFFYIPTEFLRLQSKYAYSVRMRENSVRDTFNAV